MVITLRSLATVSMMLFLVQFFAKIVLNHLNHPIISLIRSHEKNLQTAMSTDSGLISLKLIPDSFYFFILAVRKF